MTQSRARVLVVDDDPVIRRLLSVNLELEGFEVADAADGEECLERVRSFRPDVVTLDVMMPRLDGWEVLARLRADSAVAGVRVVMLTAGVTAGDRRRDPRRQADAFLSKPFEPEELVALVERLAAAARAEEA